MPILTNAKHERFCQALAKGKTADEAYEAAGYTANRGNAARLKANEDIVKRVTELLERGAIRAEITVAGLTEKLMRLAALAEDLKDAPGFSVARASLMDAAKLNGLIVDKKEHDMVEKTISAEPLSAEEWAANHASEH